MSDYLSNLAARSFPPSAALRPRLPSLFEPMSPTRAPLFDRPLGEESPEDDVLLDAVDILREGRPPIPRRREAPPAAGTPSPPGSPAPDSSQTRPDAPPVPPPETRMTQPPRPTVPVQASPERPQPPVELSPVTERAARLPVPEPPATPPHRREPPVAAPRKTTAAPPSPPIIAPVIERTVIEKVVLRETQQPPAVQKEGRAFPPSAEDRPLLPLFHADEKERVTMAAPRPAVVVQPQVMSYQSPAVAPVPAEPEPTPPSPTIQVTIGRIEVRAAPPAAPSQKPRSTSPVMSLDEYLRRRSEEERR